MPYWKSKTLKRYKALITQAGTAAPTVIQILENTIGDVTWQRMGTGTYRATWTGVGATRNLIEIQATAQDAITSTVTGTVGIPTPIIKVYHPVGATPVDGYISNAVVTITAIGYFE